MGPPAAPLQTELMTGDGRPTPLPQGNAQPHGAENEKRIMTATTKGALWVAALTAFVSSAWVQQTWFRAETPARAGMYAIEAITCAAFLLAGVELAYTRFNRLSSILIGGLGSVTLAGCVVAMFLRSRCPFHGEISLFFFALPLVVLVGLLPIYEAARLAIRAIIKHYEPPTDG